MPGGTMTTCEAQLMTADVTERRRAPSPALVLTKPLVVASLTILIINDHVLKERFANATTGKLSDVAGLLLVSILVTAYVRSRGRSERAILLALALVFAAIKTINAVTEIAVMALDAVLPWGNAVVTDPSDLVALLVMPLGARAAKKTLHQTMAHEPVRKRRCDLGYRVRNARGRALRASNTQLSNIHLSNTQASIIQPSITQPSIIQPSITQAGSEPRLGRSRLSPGQIIVLALTAFACAATSAEEPQYLSLGLTKAGDVVIAEQVSDLERYALREFENAQQDGEIPASARFDPESALVRAERIIPGLDPERVEVSLAAFDRAAKTQVCVPGTRDHCFRIFESGRISETIDGGERWDTIWSISTSSVATRRQYHYFSDRSSSVFVPLDIEVAQNGTFVVLLSGESHTSRSLDGVWILPDSTFRQMPGLFLVQSMLGFVTLAVGSSIGLKKLRAKQAIAIGILAAFTVVLLIAGYNETYIVFPIMTVLCFFMLFVTSMTAIVLSKGSKLGPNPTVGYVAGLPAVGVMVSSAPVAIWSEYNVMSFEEAASLHLMLVAAMAILLGVLTHSIRQTVATTPVVIPTPG